MSPSSWTLAFGDPPSFQQGYLPPALQRSRVSLIYSVAVPLPSLNQIRALMADGELELALEHLEPLLKEHAPRHRDEYIVHAGRLADLRRRRRTGLLTDEATNVERNRLTSDILAFTDAVERELVRVAPVGRVQTPFAKFTPMMVAGRSKGSDFSDAGGRLEQLERQFADARIGVFGRSVCVYGLGGVGKSQLVVEYAIRFRDRYPDGVVWITGGLSIDSQLATLAEQIGYTPEVSSQEKTKAATYWLDSHDGYLFIFDSIDSHDPVDQVYPKIRKPDLLVTSRELIGPEFSPLRLERLDPRDACDLVAHASHRSTDEPGWSELCSLLDYYALGLELAGGYLSLSRMSVVEYASLLKARGLDTYGLVDPSDERLAATRHVRSIRTTLSLNRDALGSRPDVLHLVELVAAWPVASVGETYLAELCGYADITAFRNTIREAERRCLIRLERDDRVGMHRLLAEVVRESTDQMTDGQLSAMGDTTLAWMERFRGVERTQTVNAELDGIEGLADILRDRGSAMWVSLYRKLGLVCATMGKIRLARDKFLAPALNEASKTASPRELAIYYKVMSDVGIRQGDLRSAFEFSLKRLHAYEASSPADSDALASANIQMASVLTLMAMGMSNQSLRTESFAQALHHNKRALYLYRSIHGPASPEAAVGAFYLGKTLESMGQLPECIRVLENAVADLQNAGPRGFNILSGHEYCDTAIAMACLADVLRLSGGRERRQSLFEQALLLASTHHGALSGKTADIYMLMSTGHVREAHYDLAGDCAEKALRIRDHIFGPNCVHCLGTLHWSAQQYHRGGADDDALRVALMGVKREGFRTAGLEARLASLFLIIARTTLRAGDIDHCRWALDSGDAIVSMFPSATKVARDLRKVRRLMTAVPFQ